MPSVVPGGATSLLSHWRCRNGTVEARNMAEWHLWMLYRQEVGSGALCHSDLQYFCRIKIHSLLSPSVCASQSVSE